MASRQLRMGVIGLGRGFMLTLPTLRDHPTIRLVVAADPREAALIRFQTDFGGRVYTEADSLLADDGVDVVYIASPHEHHATHAIAAARAGKHTLVEKPMATTLEDCLAMAEAANDSGTVLIVGPSHGFDAQVQLAAREIMTCAYGRARMITALNYTDFLYRPRRAEELDSSRGGGVVFSQAAHQIDVVRRLAGSEVTSVRAVTGNWDANRATEGAYTALMTFADGAAATLTYSGYGHYDSDALIDWISETGYRKNPDSYGKSRRELAKSANEDEGIRKLTRAYGALGVHNSHELPPFHEHFGFVLVSCEHADLRLMPNGLWIYGDCKRRFIPLPPPVMPRFEVIDALVRAIIDGVPSRHDARWGATTIDCCLALLRSSAEQREITLVRQRP